MAYIIKEYIKEDKVQEIEVLSPDCVDHVAKWLSQGNNSITKVCVFNPSTREFDNILSTYDFENST